MKKTICAVLCLLIPLLLCCCRETGQSEPTEQETGMTRTVVFISGIEDADVWILPQTEANMKTTVWGTAAVSDAKAGESVKAQIPEPGDDGQYIFRMIDAEQFYYSANGIVLEDGWTVSVKMEEGDLESVILEVTDDAGVLRATYSVFAARL